MAVPGDGVYAARLRTSGDPQTWWPAAVSVGTNPTFEGDSRRVEAHVIDAPLGYDVYDQTADLDFVTRIRPMVRFDDVADLVAQMDSDVLAARSILTATA